MTTTKSDIVTNLDASPKVFNHKNEVGGLKVVKGTLALGTGDIDDNDIIHLAKIPSSASIVSIKLFNDDLDSNGTPTLAANVGLYDKDGVVVDEDAYASAITTLQAANTAGVEVAFEARNINAINNEIWEDGGQTADPKEGYHVSVTIANGAATAAAGDLSFVIKYIG